MTAQYRLDIDVTTREGQAEILNLWSKADLDHEGHPDRVSGACSGAGSRSAF